VSGIQILERRIVENADDARAHYQLAVLLLATRDLYAPILPDAEGVLARAEKLLRRAIELDPKHALSHAKLGYTYHQRGDRLEQALASFQKARELDPKNAIVDVYVPTILVEMYKEPDALAELTAVARRRKVNLAQLRKKLRKVGFPVDARTLLTNGFIRARNFLWSATMNEAERIQNSLDRGRKQRVAKEELDECMEHQRELKRGFDASRVPPAIRSLASAASRFGVGDDVCRPILMKRIPKQQLGKLIRDSDKLARKVDEWLNTFPEGQMSAEAAAFMYLLNGIDEIR
jgi:tetratricopeptide (TPR) repeat protein